MSLTDALLLDPYRHPQDVWLAIRTDGLKGSGTESDPYNCSRIDALEIPISKIEASHTGSEWFATVTTDDPHRFSTDDWVTISGIIRYVTINGTKYDNRLYCGTFKVEKLSNYSFKYQMIDEPGSPQATGPSMLCWLEREPFDAIMRTLPENTAIHLGPGVFPTKGYSVNIGRVLYRELGDWHVSGSWEPRAGQKILGSGIGVTTLQLVGADVEFGQYWAIGCDYNTQVHFLEIADLTIDCNIAGQPQQNLVCQAIIAYGSHVHIRRVRAINFGTQWWDGGPYTSVTPVLAECFPIVAGIAHPNVPVISADCRIEDCIIEQPGMNNARETTCLSGANMGEGPPGLDQGIYLRAGPSVIRNCFLNLEYQDHPVAIAGIEAPDNGVSTVTTRLPHGLDPDPEAPEQWIRISGALVDNAPMNGLDNAYNGSYRVEAVDDSTHFTYKPIALQDDDLSDSPTGTIWLGRFPSLPVGISAVSQPEHQPEQVGNQWKITVTTMSPHFLVPDSTVQIQNVHNSNSEEIIPPGERIDISGARTVAAVLDRKHFTYNVSRDPGIITIPGWNASIGALFQGLSGAELVEGNRVFNCGTAGPYHDTGSAGTMIVRNNHYHNVFTGEFHLLGKEGGGIKAASIVVEVEDIPNKIAKFTIASEKPHGLTAGQGVRIVGVTTTIPPNDPVLAEGSYNGAYTVESSGKDASGHYWFKYRMDNLPPPNPNPPPAYLGADSNTGEAHALWQVQQLIFENNLIELVARFNNAGPPMAFNLSAVPDLVFSNKGVRVFRRVIVRNNIIRYVSNPVEGEVEYQWPGNLAVFLTSCENAVVENNVVDLGRTDQLQHRDCVQVHYFNNTQSDGTLVQGGERPVITLPSGATALGDFAKHSELTTDIEDALVLSIL